MAIDATPDSRPVLLLPYDAAAPMAAAMDAKHRLEEMLPGYRVIIVAGALGGPIVLHEPAPLHWRDQLETR